VLDGLTSRTVDLGIISEGADDPAFLAFPLCTFDMVLVGAPGHRLATPEAAPFAELAHERIITSGPQSAPRRAIEQLASVDGVRLNLVLQIEEADMVAQAVASGLGIAVSSWPFISQRLVDGHLALLHVRGFPISSEWFLVHRRETLSAPVRVLRDYLLNFPWPNGQVPASPAAV
jgi:DNA-binding transcriptional LysR family regulator